MIEDVEEGIQSLGRINPFLNIINNQHVNGLIEVNEIIRGILTHRVRELYLEQTGRDIKHTLLRIHTLALHTNGIDQMGLTATGRTIDKEWVEGRLTRMLCDRQTYRAWQFIGVSFNIIIEGLLGIQLRIQVLGHGCIKNRRRLIATCCWTGCLDITGCITLPLLILLILLVGNQTVLQTHISLETILKCPRHQTHVVLLQVFVDIRTWNLHQYGLLFLVVRLEDDWLEPRFKDLLRDVLADEMQAVVPKRLMTILHLGVIIFLLFTIKFAIL